MMTPQPYAAAHAVAALLHEYFRRHRDATGASAPLAAVPDASAIERMIDAAFWASLRREEGYEPRMSLAYLTPDQAGEGLVFDGSLPLVPAALTRVAPAVERPGIHLGIWPAGEDLRVWGTTRTIPTCCFVLEVAAPGLLVIKHDRGDERLKFVNVAVLEGEQVKMIDEDASGLPECPTLLASLLGFEAPATWNRPVNVLVQLAVSMRAHRRGGALIIVPSGNTAWRESTVEPIRYSVRRDATLASVLRRPDAEKARPEWRDALARAVDTVAGLTAVDGATLLTDQYDLLAFGAKLRRRDGLPQVEQVGITEPIQGGAAEVVHPTQVGGTRHLSAAQFVHDQREAVALVASQDGRFTIFAWSSCEQRVHAHRVEVLLL